MNLTAIFDPVWGLNWHFSKAREYPGIHKRMVELKKETTVTAEKCEGTHVEVSL